MTISLTVSVITLTAAAFFFWKRNNNDTGRVLGSRVYLKTLGVQIVCGNCAGDAESPVRTYLDTHGNCSHCGGSSYVLASTLGVYALLAREMRLYDYQAQPYELASEVANSRGHVISLEEHLAAKAERMEKLAS
jgi:hypothetical protein